MLLLWGFLRAMIYVRILTLCICIYL
jgi:hypothetical protein